MRGDEAMPMSPMESVIEIFTEIRDGINSLVRSEEHTSELQSQFRISYAVFCLKKKKKKKRKKKKKQLND